MAQALSTTDWDAVLGEDADIESANENFANAIDESAKRLRFQLFKGCSANRLKRNVKTLTQERTKLEQQINKEYIRHADEETKMKRIEANTEI